METPEPFHIPTSCTISRIVIRLSRRTSSSTLALFSSVKEVEGLPERSWEQGSSSLSLNRLCHLKTVALFKQDSPYANCSISTVSDALFPSLKQNFTA